MLRAFVALAVLGSAAIARADRAGQGAVATALRTVKSGHAQYFASPEPGHDATKDVKLSASQLQRVLQALRAPSTFGDDEPVCFTPHHGFTLFDKDGGKIAAIELSLGCARITSDELDLPLGLSQEGVKTMTKLFGSLRLPTDDQPWQ